MSESKRIQEQLDQVYNGPAWHGPSLKQYLDGVTAEMAAQYPIEGAHSIWELVQHQMAWMNVLISTLDGEPYVVLPPEQDWAPVAATDQAAWDAAVGIMDSTFEALCGAIGDFPEEKLDETVPGMEFSYYYLLHGLVSHSAYHTGQIGLLRKITG